MRRLLMLSMVPVAALLAAALVVAEALRGAR